MAAPSQRRSRRYRRGGNAGSLSSGLHHAAQDHGAGFCTFNGLARAARAALDDGRPRTSYRRVLIIDLDAHGGGGTYSIVRRWEGVVHLDVAVSRYETYAPHRGSTLDYVTQPAEYCRHSRLDFRRSMIVLSSI
jgi:acetoin utilization deacetylase AcuC-like enzyme